MPTLSSFITFAVATLLLNLTPGPDMMYVIGRSVGQGRRAGIVSALGIGAGILVHTAAVSLGVAALLRSWPVAFQVVRYAGAVYLIYLGARLVAGCQASALPGDLPAENLSAIFRQGVVTNVLNPKVALFFLAFLPQFVSPAHGAVALPLLALGLYFNFSGTLVNLAVAYLAGAAGNFLRSSRRRELAERASGAVFIALSLRVGLTRSA
jgi:threonine/homoserine/homoserine lactone efflux protein